MNKRGLSNIVGSLLMILLVLAAAAILFVVIKNFVENSTEKVELDNKCLEIGLSVINVDSVGENYTVTIERTMSGEDIAGIKFIFENETDSVSRNETGIELGEKETYKFNNIGMSNANKITAVPYFLNKAEKEHYCSKSFSKEII